MDPSSTKSNKYNFRTGLKKTENRNRKNGIHVKKKQKILHNFDKTHEEIFKMRGQKFLGCRRLYLRKAKSLRKRPLEDDS